MNERFSVTSARGETILSFMSLILWNTTRFWRQTKPSKPLYIPHGVPTSALTSISPVCVRTTISWALLPVSVARAKIASSEGRLTYRRLETPPPTRSLCLMISKAYLETTVIQEFLECCSEYVDERTHLIRSPDFQL